MLGQFGLWGHSDETLPRKERKKKKKKRTYGGRQVSPQPMIEAVQALIGLDDETLDRRPCQEAKLLRGISPVIQDHGGGILFSVQGLDPPVHPLTISTSQICRFNQNSRREAQSILTVSKSSGQQRSSAVDTPMGGVVTMESEGMS